MLEWLTANLGTILISAGLLVVVILIIRYLLRQKKAAPTAPCTASATARAASTEQGRGNVETRSPCVPKGGITMIETILKVDGMACGMCESHINDTVRNRFPVQKVTSSHTKGETVILSPEPLDEQALRAAISATGYTVTAVDAHPYEKKGLFSFHKK